MNNSFRLSEEEIIEIYRSENITLSKYNEQIKEYKKNIDTGISIDEILLQTIFGNDKEIIERKNELRKKFKYPTKKYLSTDLQKKVVEGSLHIVFDSTRNWYKFFDGKLSMERIYYVCLEALINSAKYILHCEQPIFKFYVLKSIERNIIKYVARWEHITYREAHEIINNYLINSDHVLGNHSKELGLSFDYDSSEELEKPSKIFYRLKNNSYDIDYLKNVSSEEFMKDYICALDNLDDIEKLVMQMSFDIEGNRGLTNAEIADYLGIDINQVSNTRRKAKKNLRNNIKLNMYRRY